MITPSTEISDAERAVQNFKHEQMVRVMRAILEVSFQQPYFSPADIPEDICADEDRAGCASNAWNTLRSLEIIERLPLNYTNEDWKIFGGRTKNTNKNAKGRWVAMYKLRSRSLADTWLARNGAARQQPQPQPMEQMALV